MCSWCILEAEWGASEQSTAQQHHRLWFAYFALVGGHYLRLGVACPVGRLFIPLLPVLARMKEEQVHAHHFFDCCRASGIAACQSFSS